MLGFSSFLIHPSSTSSRSGTAFKIVGMSALLTLSQTRLHASWYVVAKHLYASSLSSDVIDEVESSKTVSASSMVSKNLDVVVGCLAAVDTILPEVVALGVVFVLGIMRCTTSQCSTILEIFAIFFLKSIQRIHCFDLRMQWYSYQSNRLMNWLV